MQQGMGGSTEGRSRSIAPPRGSKRMSNLRSLSRERVRADRELDDYFKLSVLLREGNIVSTDYKTAHIETLYE